MNFKLDENIGRRGVELLRSAGHDVLTVRDQGLQGADDEAVFKVCCAEGRALITLDHDFGQVMRFPPEVSRGLVILALPSRASLQALLGLLRDFLSVLEARPIRNELWIVEPGRVRVHQRESEEP